MKVCLSTEYLNNTNLEQVYTFHLTDRVLQLLEYNQGVVFTMVKKHIFITGIFKIPFNFPGVWCIPGSYPMDSNEYEKNTTN